MKNKPRQNILIKKSALYAFVASQDAIKRAHNLSQTPRDPFYIQHRVRYTHMHIYTHIHANIQFNMYIYTEAHHPHMKKL